MDDIHYFTFPNGIRLVHKQIPHTQVSHCAIMLDIGSRDEKPHQQGLAHFWEHMAFKGTKKRNSFHILNRLETVGGELNAYTTKEKVTFHASVLKQHFERSLELLTDIAFHSTFPEKQVDRERNVILEEMSMYYDSPEDAIQDDFDEVIFTDHQLGKNILGNQESVKVFSRDDLQTFIDENLDTEQIVVASIGNLDFKLVKKLAEKYLIDIPYQKSARNRNSPTVYSAKKLKTKRVLTQAQIALGGLAYPIMDDKRLPFYMLINLLGGPAMNSRFNVSLREKQGLVYSIDANYTSYLDTGYFGIFFGTEPKNVEKSMYLIKKEFDNVRNNTLTKSQLITVKEQLKGQLAMSEEGNLGFMLMMARNLLDINKIETMEEIFNQIDLVNPQMLQNIANEMFNENQISTLTFLPK